MYGNNISSGMVGMNSIKSLDNNHDGSIEKEKESRESSSKKLDKVDSSVTNSEQKNRLIDNKNLHREIKNDIDKQYSNY